VILRLFPELGVKHPELQERRDELLQDMRPFDNATPAGLRIEAPDVQRALQEEGFDFYEFQSLDLGYIRAVLEHHGGAYIGWERGLGKTMASPR
jgi:hypothetical protein